jgi:glycerophosphoryl diester phosphodiesterase
MLCIGHGGASQVAPANSLESFAIAAALGADRIEFDVRLWRGELAIAHTAFDARRPGCLDLDEALGELSTPRYDDIGLVVDLKTPGIAEPVVDRLRRYGVFDRALLTTQCPPILRAVRAYAPTARTGISVAGYFSRVLQRWGAWRDEVITAIRAGHYDALMAHHRLVDPELVERVHGAGAEIHAWTIDGARALRPLRLAGVDGVVTGDPRLMHAAA